MLVGVLSTARERGWAAEAILFESSQQAEWLSDFETAGIPVTLAPDSTKGSRLAISRWLRPRLARRPGPKVLHSHFTAWDVPSALAAVGRRDTNVYWHVHSVLPHSAASIARGSAKFGLIGRTVTGVFCPAPNVVDAVVERRAKPERVHFLPSAVDLRLFPVAGDDERLRAREALGLPADATILLHFGWDFKIKGGDYFVETVAELAKRGHGDVLGLSRGGDEQTTALAEKLGVSERVRLQPPVEDARLLFAAADLLVSSSREEGMAYSVLEALCSGIPVVATNSAGNVFLGENVEACRIVSPNTAELVEAVEATLARDAETAKREPVEARDWIRDNLDVAAIANDLLDRYESDLRARGMPA
jgi:glycosyltransferase involved in cell wall biosynthesis